MTFGLIELYLAEALGVSWDRVHEEADKWEHVLSEDLEARMDEILGPPTRDPHGSPIPTRQGTLPAFDQAKLIQVAPGETAIISEVSDHSAKCCDIRAVGALSGNDCAGAGADGGSDVPAGGRKCGRYRYEYDCFRLC